MRCRLICVVVWTAGIIGVMLAGASVAGLSAAGEPVNECLRCHAGLADSRLSAPAVAFRDDVHGQRGFTCVECHGGDPAAADKVKAKSPSAGFRGVPRGQGQIQACARCHGDAAVMRTFAPKQRVDQAVEYAASGHGKRLATGDTRVATCASCHGAHGIRAVSDVKSPVYPTNVAATCASCHADAGHMKRPDGSSLPTTQRADYEKSVHFSAMTAQHDLSAPTCNDCHGNHGAMPPGVSAITNVCGTCHAVFSTKFSASPHAPIFEKACVECHGNHAVGKPSDAMIGTEKTALCSTCHADADDPGKIGAGKMRAGIDRLKSEIARASGLIERVKTAGMEVTDQELALGEARGQLIRVRTEIHSFNPALVEPVVQEGLTIVAGVDRAGQGALSELRFRRWGLALSLGVMLIVVLALALKIREVDRRSG